MILRRLLTSLVARTGVVLSFVLLGRATASVAQAIAPPLPAWELGPLPANGTKLLSVGTSAALSFGSVAGTATRSHTRTGLLVGGIIGLAATTVFLIGFCSDSDTKCEADEVGRAVLFIAVPAAALGAVIGSLIRTEE